MTLTSLAAKASLLALVGLVGCGVLVDHRADKREALAEATFPPEGQFVDVNGRRIHAVVKGKGPDLVLIHGASGSTRDFTFRFVDRISDRFRVIVFDRPGLGYSDRAAPGLDSAFASNAESPAQQAVLLQAAAAQLGADKPLVLGHSYGGAVALAWALERPDNIAGLAVVSGVSNPWPGGLGRYYTVNGSAFGGAVVVPLITAFAPKSMIDAAVADVFAPQDPPAGYAASIGTGLTLRRDTLRANTRQVNTLRPHIVDMAPRYGDISVPTEIIHGQADDIVPFDIHALPLSGQIVDANLTALPGIGHMPQHVAPDAVTDALDRLARRAGLR